MPDYPFKEDQRMRSVPLEWLDSLESSEYLVPMKEVWKARRKRIQEKDFIHGSDRPGALAKLIIDIKNNGISNPIRLTKLSDGEIVVSDGSHRYLCAKFLHLREVPIKMSFSPDAIH